jgi:2-polyprenyl-3-methyl-5-hydroxy-6-metoxy-1,4-benzoquinol methylase
MQPNMDKRSYQKELLDRDDIPFEDIKRNMHELDIINTLLGGHRITIEGIKSLISTTHNKEFVICEIGCGGGDNLAAINKYFDQSNVKARFIGIDINPHCIHYAKTRFAKAHYLQSDYKEVMFEKKPDIIFSSLFCHHFNDEGVVNIFKWMKANSTLGFFINDLHRNILAFHSINLITAIFSKSYLVKHDAPLSVKRGFKRSELKLLLDNAGIRHSSINWKWAFRWLVIVNHEQPGTNF